MKKKFLFAAAALAMLASCSQNDDLNSAPVVADVENNAITFGTYVGGVSSTRATATGNITSAQVLAQKGGFGVFAYYTHQKTYNEANYAWEAGVLKPTVMPNFMYNQQVRGTDVASPAWSYQPIKYWPNDFSSSAVDNQTTDPATGTNTATTGGNVSFFAYAPYVAYGSLDSPVGITDMSNNATAGDPTVTYTITNGTAVATTDLLWGTFSGTGERVVTGGNTGVTGDNTASNDNIGNRTYENSILGTYTTNADLNKQKIAGKVGFAFKHALAGFGGGSNGSASYGFQVQLDIDDDDPSAAITGGTREKFDAGSGSDDAWRTIVTIKDIEISNDLNNNSSIDAGEVALAQSGTLNLATGQWTPGTTGVVKQTIGTNISPSPTYNAVLNTKIAEVYNNSGSTWFTQLTSTDKKDYFRDTNAKDKTTQHPGVMETAQDVFNTTDQAPLMIIPGQTPKFRITVDYIVRTYDENLQEKCTMVEQKISKTISFVNPVELNKHYNLIMHLGLTGIKFDATVSNWVEGSFDGDGDSADDDNFVHLPINVN